MQTELIGYPDRWSVAAGEAIRFMVSTDARQRFIRAADSCG